VSYRGCTLWATLWTHIRIALFMFIMYEYLILLLLIRGRFQWPRGLRRGSTAARLLGLWVRILPRAWMSVSCECCVLSGRGLCDELVPRPEESYRVWCVWMCDREASKNEAAYAPKGLSNHWKKKNRSGMSKWRGMHCDEGVTNCKGCGRSRMYSGAISDNNLEFSWRDIGGHGECQIW
jgi:hypothetical protein